MVSEEDVGERRRGRDPTGRSPRNAAPRSGSGPGRGGVAGLLAPVLLVVGALAACSGDITFQENRKPFLYLVLNEFTPAGGPEQPALLLRQIRADSAAYLEADRFEMRRTSDGAQFDWRNEHLFGFVPFEDVTSANLSQANYILADSLSARGLGRDSLEPGATYEVRITTERTEITGTVTIPDSFSVTIAGQGADRRAVWPDVDGAGGYSVRLAELEGSGTFLQRDTSISLSAESRRITVRAVDPQAFRYLIDPNLRSSGVRGGLGVLGAIQVVRRDIPEPSPREDAPSIERGDSP